MIVDFTGAQVRKGDELAVLYSPELYANQIEMLEAKKAVDQDTSNLQRIIDANPNDGIATLGDVLPDDDFDGDLRTNREEFRRFSDPTNPTQFGKAGDVDRDNNLTILDLIRLNNHLRSHHLLDEDAHPFGDFDLNDLLDHHDRDLRRGALLAPSP